VNSLLLCLELETRDVPTFLGNQIFPLDNPWNQVIANAPVAANSAAIIAAIDARHGGTPPHVHPDFGNPATDGALYGIPINVVTSSTPAVPVLVPAFGYPDESDLVPVPIPANAVIEGDGPSGPSDPSDPAARGDSHLLVYDRTANVLYELVSAARPNEASFPYGGAKPIGAWGAYQISVWNLNTDSFRTVGETSADAAGLPIMPGLVRPDEALATQPVIDHAIRMTVQQTLDAFVFPASHVASSNTASDLPRMGERFRLRADFAIPANWAPEVKAMAQAMKTYGLIVADNGSDMYFQGTPSTQWNMDEVLQIAQIQANDFDVVDLTPAVNSLSAAFGSPVGGTSLMITGRNFSGAAGQIHVMFGTAAATSVTIVSDSQLNVVIPAHAAGTVDVTVQSGHTVLNVDNNPVFFGYGTSATNAGDRFTFSTSSPPPASPPPAADAADSISIGGATDGSAVIETAGSSGQYSARATVFPFGAIAADLRTAVGDVNGDGTPDQIFATGPGVPFQVAVLSGTDLGVLVAPFEPFGDFTAGGFVSAGDFRHSGRAQIVVTPDRAGGPRVSIYELTPGAGLVREANYFTLDSSFRGGLRTAVGDLNDDGVPDLAIAAGFGGGPRISIIDGRQALTTDGFNPADHLTGDFFAFESTLRNGVYLAIGDIDGDGFGDLIFGAGPGGGPRVLIVSGKALLAGGAAAALAEPLGNFFASPDNNDRGGVRVAALNVDHDSMADIATGTGENQPSRVRVYLGKNIGAPPLQEIDPFQSTILADGVFVD
jgi:hypothetical protein